MSHVYETIRVSSRLWHFVNGSLGLTILQDAAKSIDVASFDQEVRSATHNA